MTFKMPPVDIGATLLTVLPAIALDTETTGLDVAAARVIEIGAMRLWARDDSDEATFACLVSPGLAIPPATTAIHGITDQDVSAAPAFASAMERFTTWAGPAVVIGFSIGFDLALLKAEHERHGLAWRAPRALDVRHLLEVLSPALGALSLDTAAVRFGIEVDGRHRALADARVAADVFIAILPMLRDKGIRTLAEAERAIASRASTGQDGSRAGWVEARDPDAAGRASAKPGLGEYARIDSFAFRHRVGDLMAAPPVVTGATTPLRAALKLMSDKRISSLFVDFADDGPDGIITERDVLRALARHDAAALDAPVGPFAARPLVTIPPDEFVYAALTLMATRGFRHLGVVDHAGHLVGALSARDLLKQRADDAVALGGSIEAAGSARELGQIWLKLPKVAKALDLEEIDARDISAVISRELRNMTRRASELAEAELVAAGHGAPPCPYTVFVLGSGGRGESLLAMDQDNGIVYADGPDRDATDAWFERLAKRITQILDAAGVVYCKGGVMASNAAWRMPVSAWKTTVHGWIGRTQPQDILSCDIFFDSVAVHGQSALFEEVWTEAAVHAGKSRSFQSLLALTATNITSPFNWLGRLKLDGGRVDLKRHGLLPIFSAARVVALQNGVTARSTRDRLNAARVMGLATDTIIDDLLECHRIALELILRQQLRDLNAGIKLTNQVAPSELTAFEREELTWALSHVPLVANLLGTPAV